MRDGAVAAAASSSRTSCATSARSSDSRLMTAVSNAVLIGRAGPRTCSLLLRFGNDRIDLCAADSQPAADAHPLEPAAANPSVGRSARPLEQPPRVIDLDERGVGDRNRSSSGCSTLPLFPPLLVELSAFGDRRMLAWHRRSPCVNVEPCFPSDPVAMIRRNIVGGEVVGLDALIAKRRLDLFSHDFSERVEVSLAEGHRSVAARRGQMLRSGLVVE